MSVHDRIRAELDAVPEEEVRAARQWMEAQPDFPGWTACPFGGWALWILGAVRQLRESPPCVADEPVVTEALAGRL